MPEDRKNKELGETDTMSSLCPDVIPLKNREARYARTSLTPPSILLIRPALKHKDTTSSVYSIVFPSEALDTEGKNHFRAGSVSYTLLRQLKRLAWPIDQTLDLHTFTQQQASKRLTQFFESALAQEHRCLLIIHGKGVDGCAPLKRITRRGLEMNAPPVLAFCTAPLHLGGEGATLVLLQKKKR